MAALQAPNVNATPWDDQMNEFARIELDEQQMEDDIGELLKNFGSILDIFSKTTNVEISGETHLNSSFGIYLEVIGMDAEEYLRVGENIARFANMLISHRNDFRKKLKEMQKDSGTNDVTLFRIGR